MKAVTPTNLLTKLRKAFCSRQRPTEYAYWSTDDETRNRTTFMITAHKVIFPLHMSKWKIVETTILHHVGKVLRTKRKHTNWKKAPCFFRFPLCVLLVTFLTKKSAVVCWVSDFAPHQGEINGGEPRDAFVSLVQMKSQVSLTIANG